MVFTFFIRIYMYVCFEMNQFDMYYSVFFPEEENGNFRKLGIM